MSTPLPLTFSFGPQVLGWLGLIPLVILGIAGAIFLASWLRARARICRHYAAPLRLLWATGSEAVVVDEATDAELKGLGYQPSGTLVRREPSPCRMAVYTHRDLPIYAFVVQATPAPDPQPQTPGHAIVLDSFFAGGERITTSGQRGAREDGALVEPGIPRLVQFRVDGTATALDGQHVGTLKAWTQSRNGAARKALPATHEALIGYLEADHVHTRAALEARGWVRPDTLIRLLTGKPRNCLGF